MHIRLTEKQKTQLNEIFEELKSENYESSDSQRLNDSIESLVESFIHYNEHDDDNVLISKPEVHNQIWNAFKKSGAGKIIDFQNGDSDPNYNKGMLINKTIFEAVLDALLLIVRKLLGDPQDNGNGKAGSRPPILATRRRQYLDSAYER